MTTAATYKRRLLSVAKKLDRLPRKRFYYGSFVGQDWKGNEDLSCGTTACAMGWATTLPSLRRLGLRLEEHGSPSVNGDSETESVARIFGISPDEYWGLFGPSGYCVVLDRYAPSHDAGPKAVARHIRAFCKAKWGGK